MGAQAQKGTPCCARTSADLDRCCAKGGPLDCEIVQARPLEYPGLDGVSELQGQSGDGTLPEGATTNGANSLMPFGTDLSGTYAEWPDLDQGTDLHEHIEDWEVYADNSRYRGQLLNKKRHGHGTWRSSLQHYEGEWKDDRRHGLGQQTWKDGRMYDGQFKEGKFHGKGRMEWHTSKGLMVFDGQYVGDLKHGAGMYRWPDGRVYDGQWVGGQRSGRALYVSSRGDEKYGYWKEDKLDRWCEPDELPPSAQ